MRINHNISALNAWQSLGQTDNAMTKSLERLSSGLRINRAADDAAGLAISEKMRGQIRGLNQAVRNAQDAISLIQTAEGALNESHSILQRMRELAVQSATDTNTDADRLEIQKEIDQLAAELTRIADTTEFNTKALLDGNFSGTFHIGANKGQKLSLSVGDMRAKTLGASFEFNATSIEGFDTNTAVAIENDGIYTATKMMDKVNVGSNDDNDDNEIIVEGAKYALLDGDGKAVAVSKDGEYYYLLEEATEISALGIDIEIVTDDDEEPLTVKFGEKVESGSVAFEIIEVAGEDDSTTNTINATATGGISVLDQEKADNAIKTFQDALDAVSTERSKLGAVQNRLEHTIANLGVAAENLTAAESRIRDVDMAQEIMEFTKNQILIQAGTAMLANANVRPQSVLQLLG